MKNSKLKRKIWLTSFMIFITFIVIAALNLNMIITTLSIIIPSSILTLGMPPYLMRKQAIRDRKQIKQESQNENQEKEIEFNLNRQKIKKEITSIKRENSYDESQEIKTKDIQQKRKIIKKGTM